MQPSDRPDPQPDIPKNDPPPEHQDAPDEIDLPPTTLPSEQPVRDRSRRYYVADTPKSLISRLPRETK